MVDEQKTEQRGQAIKRLRSLFDMHHIAFGTKDDLGGLMLSLHDNRHFAMDFWSVVNTFSEDGSGLLNKEEMLEAVVESATGAGSSALPEHERPGVHELRLMLSGVDVARPAPIAKPTDALMPNQNVAATFSGSTDSVATSTRDDALRSRRSIGEALAKLEQSTRELREQLAQLDSQFDSKHDSKLGVHPAEARPLPVETQLADVHPDEEQQAETIARWNGIASTPDTIEELPKVQEASEQTASPLAEAVPPRVPAPIPIRLPEQPLPPVASVLATAPVAPAAPPAQPAPQPLAAPTMPVAKETEPPVPAAAEKEVFTPRPAHTLSKRGLAIPEPDDDPAIAAPLSGYAADSERRHTGSYVIAAMIAALAVAGFAGARTQAGHAMLQSAATAIHSKYNALTGKSDSTTSAAPAPAESPSAEAKDSSATPAIPDSPQPQQPPPNATATAPAASSAPAPVSMTPAPAAAPAAQGRPPEASQAPPRPRATLPFVDTSVLRVPASTMAANLITSRVPAYPEAARSQEIEGPVTLEVVISEEGTVRHAHAVEGDPHLRAAAEDAVLRWRYKPYLLAGSPVEISTTVRVEFRLPQ